MEDDKTREMKLRNWAKRLRLSLHKSRAKRLNLDPNHRYMIKDTNQNIVLKGENYEMSLDDVEKFLKDYEGNVKLRQ